MKHQRKITSSYIKLYGNPWWKKHESWI